MSKLDFQFHAMEDEIIQVIKEEMLQYDLFLVSMNLFPDFNSKLVRKDEFDEEVDALKSSRMLILCKYKPDISQNDYNQFFKINKDFLIFEIGGQKDCVLTESRISTITENVETMKIWKAIVKKFKKDMLKGAWLINPRSGAKAYYKDHKYTLSAKNAFLGGVKIIPFIGNSQFVLSETI